MKHSIIAGLFMIMVGFLSGCTERIISFSDLYSSMECSQDISGKIAFKSFLKHRSYEIPSRYYLTSHQTNGSTIHYITYFWGTSSNTIILEPWGIQALVEIPNVKINEDQFFYKDTTGSYRIVVGSEASWKSKVEDSQKKLIGAFEDGFGPLTTN